MGKNGGSYYTIDIAIQIAQWINPYFALQVSGWTRELLLFGKVELGNEKTPLQLESKLQQILSVDITEYEKDDVLYVATFTATDEYINKYDDDKIFGKFGVSSGIDKRLKQHNADDKFLNYKILKNSENFKHMACLKLIIII
jgi:4-amino-4-deoxy-L-arabinose transferase-like glycosyltransferase